MQCFFSLPLCLTLFFNFNLYASNCSDNTQTPDSDREQTPSRSRREFPLIETRAESAMLQKRSSDHLTTQRRKSSGNGLRIPIERSPSSSPKISPRKVPAYVLWELNQKNLPAQPLFVCSFEDANKNTLRNGLSNKAVDRIFFFVDPDADNNILLNAEPNDIGIEASRVENARDCALILSLISSNDTKKSIAIFGLNNSKIAHEFLTQLTIIGLIKNAHAEKTLFHIKNKRVSIDGKQCVSLNGEQLNFDQEDALRTAALLSKQALLRVFNSDEARILAMFSVPESGQFQQFCLRIMLPLLPLKLQEACKGSYLSVK